MISYSFDSTNLLRLFFSLMIFTHHSLLSIISYSIIASCKFAISIKETFIASFWTSLAFIIWTERYFNANDFTIHIRSFYLFVRSGHFHNSLSTFKSLELKGLEQRIQTGESIFYFEQTTNTLLELAYSSSYS